MSCRRGGVSPVRKYASTASSMQMLPCSYAVWPSPAEREQRRRTRATRRGASDDSYGVAGSPVVPTTKIGAGAGRGDLVRLVRRRDRPVRAGHRAGRDVRAEERRTPPRTPAVSAIASSRSGCVALVHAVDRVDHLVGVRGVRAVVLALGVEVGRAAAGLGRALVEGLGQAPARKQRPAVLRVVERHRETEHRERLGQLAPARGDDRLGVDLVEERRRSGPRPSSMSPISGQAASSV